MTTLTPSMVREYENSVQYAGICFDDALAAWLFYSPPLLGGEVLFNNDDGTLYLFQLPGNEVGMFSYQEQFASYENVWVLLFQDYTQIFSKVFTSEDEARSFAAEMIASV